MSFFIRQGDTFYFLDATTKVNTTYPAKLSTNPQSNRQVGSDGYLLDLPTCVMSGVVSDIKVFDTAPNQKSTSEYIDGLRTARQNKSSVSLKNRLDLEETGGWFITSLSILQDKANGYGGLRRSGDNAESASVIQSFRITITLKQALYATGLKAIITPDKAFLDALQAKASSSQKMKEFGEGTVETTKREDADVLKADKIRQFELVGKYFGLSLSGQEKVQP